jgi:photosystem II stability/assembly factor-like uncharacterized protein
MNWMVAGPGQILNSTNSGINWYEGIPWHTNYWSAIGWSADGSRRVAADPGGGFIPARLFTSTNAGVDWTSTTYSYDDWTSLAASKDGSKWMATSLYSQGGVYFSGDAGQTWSQTTDSGSSSVACSADGHRWLTAQGSGVFLSMNSGATWIKTTAPTADWVSVASSADGIRLVAIANNGPIYLSTNSGVDWTDSGAPTNYWSSVSSSADGHKLVAVVGWYNPHSGGYWSGPIYTLQTAPAPVLMIYRSDGNLLLSWLVPSIKFVLQQNSDLAKTNWTDVRISPTLNYTNLHYEVSLQPEIGPMFYRLAFK